jgi:hypothetical protein
MKIPALWIREVRTLLHLLLAAETQQHSVSEAKNALDEYLKKLKSTEPATALHPWSLLVAARLDDDISEELLTLYSELFPIQQRASTTNKVHAATGLREVRKSV